MRLTATDKKTGKYVDSITTKNPQFIGEFLYDFKDCNITREYEVEE